jgi:fluoride exporter
MIVLVWVGVVLIGGAGSVLRFIIDGAVTSRSGRSFPFGTLVVNLSGATLLGLIAGLALNHDEALLVGTAAVGSYTTFSTWMLETHTINRADQRRAAAVNVALSVALGLAAVAVGRALA